MVGVKGCALLMASVLFVLVLGMARTAHAEDCSDVFKVCEDKETTYEKKKCQQDAMQKLCTFVGDVRDIESETRLTVGIDSGNYANVYFKKPVAEKLHKDDSIRFTGKITHFGTGILTHHTIRDADLL